MRGEKTGNPTSGEQHEACMLITIGEVEKMWDDQIPVQQGFFKCFHYNFYKAPKRQTTTLTRKVHHQTQGTTGDANCPDLASKKSENGGLKVDTYWCWGVEVREFLGNQPPNKVIYSYPHNTMFNYFYKMIHYSNYPIYVYLQAPSNTKLVHWRGRDC